MLPSRGVALAAVACALVAACKSPPAKEPVITESGSPEEAAKEIKSLLAEAYQGVRRSNAPGMMSLAAPDIFVAGPRHGDIGIERSAALVTLDDAIRVKKTHKVKSVKLAVGAAMDGRSAWAVDQIDVDGKGYVVVALAAELDGLWALTAVQVARAGGDAEAPAAAPPGWKAPAAGPNPAHSSAVADAVKVLAQLTGEPDLRVDYLDHYADRQSIVVRAGGGKKAALRGVKAIKKAWKKKPPVWTVGAPIAAASTPDGAFAWVLAPAAMDDEPAGSRRVLMVLEKFEPEVVEMDGDEGGDDDDDGDDEPPVIQGLPWRLVVLHESAPAP
ncbi:MAG TPA: hypothetical protein VM261_01960 [Kofleriaceae bacterium]|nr:hypothetical protein [Kofleriaceae bacterium]